jgi:hypothetical protein
MWRKNKPPTAGAANAIATGESLTTPAVAQDTVVAETQSSVTVSAIPFAPPSAAVATASPIVHSPVLGTNVPVVSAFSFDQTLLMLASAALAPATGAPATLNVAATDSAFDEMSTLSDAPSTVDGRLSAIPTESTLATIWESL